MQLFGKSDDGMKTVGESYEDNLATAVINKVGLVANILSDQVLFLTLSNKEKVTRICSSQPQVICYHLI